MKRLVGLMMVGWMLLGTRAALAQRGPLLLATPPEPPTCANDKIGWKLNMLVPQSDIVAVGSVEPAEQGVFKFQINNHLVGDEGVSAVDVMHFNSQHYGIDCAEEFSQIDPLFSPVIHRNVDYLMAFSIIEGNQVQVNGVLPLQPDQTFLVNVGEDDITEFKSLTVDQLRHEIQGTTPTPSNIPIIMMVGLIVVAVGAGIAAFIAWRRQRAA